MANIIGNGNKEVEEEKQKQVTASNVKYYVWNSEMTVKA